MPAWAVPEGDNAGMTIAHVADADGPALGRPVSDPQSGLEAPSQPTPVTVDPDTRHRLLRALRILAAARRRDESGSATPSDTP